MSRLNPITHYGYNLTHIGHHSKPGAWVPVGHLTTGEPVRVIRDAFGKVKGVTPLREYLQRLVDTKSRLCRIWVLSADQTSTCVYWYQQGVLDELP